MTKKIMRSTLIVAASVLLASLIIVMGCLYGYFGNLQSSQLEDELSVTASMVETYGDECLKAVQSEHYRYTLIEADGTVSYDTWKGASDMENHADREEFQQALKYGSGSSTRYSATLLEKTTYVAKALSDGSVLRVSASYASAGFLALGMLHPIVIVLIIALFLSAVLARRLSKRIVEPLNGLDLENPLENDTYEEISPLLTRINQQHKEIDLQVKRLQRRRDEFEQITGSMKEALILLDIRGLILSINPAAQRIFGVGTECVGADFLTIDRGHEINRALKAAMSEGHQEIETERDGRMYQVDISRIESAGAILGCVILVFDITERAYAERNRREFTANVSHELKTPLQGIIGSAELLESGMVKAEDAPRFVGHIRSEARRLVALIDDIIRLSQLDEGSELPCEDVELCGLAREVTETLAATAASKNVSISFENDAFCGNGGGSAHGLGTVMVRGVRRLLYEIIYNLCENAIKYNVDGGTVKVSVTSGGDAGAGSEASSCNAGSAGSAGSLGTGKTVVLTVEDSGIGIAKEEQERIFERFYRVDKSHSKASGGTGLGLSIVKHAVAYHHGKIDMESEPGKGTRIRVIFQGKA